MSGEESRRLGRWGEDLAAAFLEEKGCRIVDRNWKCRCGELDLVARDRSGTVCFVEVKLRQAGSAALPREAVDPRKQQRLRSAAAMYLSQHELDAPARFDVAEVYTDENHRITGVIYLADAFQ